MNKSNQIIKKISQLLPQNEGLGEEKFSWAPQDIIFTKAGPRHASQHSYVIGEDTGISSDMPNHLNRETLSRNLSPDHAKTIRDYTVGGYSAINNQLRNKTNPWSSPRTKEEKDAQNEKISKLKEVTNNPTRHTFSSFRGIQDASPDQFSPGKVFQDKGFTSTSLHKKIAQHIHTLDDVRDYGGTLFHIHIQRGDKAASFAPHTAFPEEHEVVIHPGTKFEVTHHSTDEEGKPVVHLRIHSQED